MAETFASSFTFRALLGMEEPAEHRVCTRASAGISLQATDSSPRPRRPSWLSLFMKSVVREPKSEGIQGWWPGRGDFSTTTAPPCEHLTAGGPSTLWGDSFPNVPLRATAIMLNLCLALHSLGGGLLGDRPRCTEASPETTAPHRKQKVAFPVSGAVSTVAHSRCGIHFLEEQGDTVSRGQRVQKDDGDSQTEPDFT